MADSGTVLLIHGGLWDDTGADSFWRRTGVADGLTRRGFKVIAPDRLRRPTDWTAEARHIASAAGLAGDDAPSASQDKEMEVIARSGARGAVLVAGLATAVVIGLWIAFYLFVFVPRGAAP